jgi:hypothetical protein
MMDASNLNHLCTTNPILAAHITSDRCTFNGKRVSTRYGLRIACSIDAIALLLRALFNVKLINIKNSPVAI